MLSRSPRKMLLVALVCAVGLIAAVTASATLTHGASRPKTVVVTLHNYMFNPMTVHIKVGTTVKWHWEDGVDGTHNITPEKKPGGLLFKGTGTKTTGYYSYTFTKPGKYYYECTIHPASMQAEIIVTK